MLNLKTLCAYCLWGGEVCQKVTDLFMLIRFIFQTIEKMFTRYSFRRKENKMGIKEPISWM